MSSPAISAARVRRAAVSASTSVPSRIVGEPLPQHRHVAAPQLGVDVELNDAELLRPKAFVGGKAGGSVQRHGDRKVFDDAPKPPPIELRPLVIRAMHVSHRDSQAVHAGIRDETASRVGIGQGTRLRGEVDVFVTLDAAQLGLDGRAEWFGERDGALDESGIRRVVQA